MVKVPSPLSELQAHAVSGVSCEVGEEGGESKGVRLLSTNCVGEPAVPDMAFHNTPCDLTIKLAYLLTFMITINSILYNAGSTAYLSNIYIVCVFFLSQGDGRALVPLEHSVCIGIGIQILNFNCSIDVYLRVISQSMFVMTYSQRFLYWWLSVIEWVQLSCTKAQRSAWQRKRALWNKRCNDLQVIHISLCEKRKSRRTQMAWERWAQQRSRSLPK